MMKFPIGNRVKWLTGPGCPLQQEAFRLSRAKELKRTMLRTGVAGPFQFVLLIR
jgi:hypothetical protein